jgi:phage gp29-like protein
MPDKPRTTLAGSILSLFTGLEKKRAPLTNTRAMSPMHIRPTQAQNYDVDFVAGVIQSAQSGDITPLLTLYRDMEAADSTILSAIATRKLAVMAYGFNVVAPENSGEEGDKIADQVKSMLQRSESFVDACMWLLHGTIWPVSIVEKKWIPGPAGAFAYPEFRDVPLELYDYTQRTLRLKQVGTAGEPLATTNPIDTNRYIVHRGHLMKTPDNWGGPLRALVFWYLFSTQDREWWARFLERFGSPFLVGHYDKNDDESRMMLIQAFQEATRIFGIVATRETEVEIKEGAGKADASQAFQTFFDCAKNEKLLVILGQTLSGNATSTGLGSGLAQLQGSVKQEYKLWDCFKLGECIKTNVVKPWMRLNGIKGPVPTVTFGGFDPAMFAAMADLLQRLPGAGLELADDSIQVVSKLLGLGLQRKAAPAPMPGLGFGGGPGEEDLQAAIMLAASGLPPVVVANEAVASGGAADLRRGLSRDLAWLGEVVTTSRNKPELIGRLAAGMARFRPLASQPVIEASVVPQAANGLIPGSKDPADLDPPRLPGS